MKASEVLRRARKLIERPEAWGKGARNRGGSRGLDTFCAAEAIEESPGSTGAVRTALDSLRRSLSANEIVAWNDAPERTHAEVLQAFDKAIELAEAEESHAG